MMEWKGDKFLKALKSGTEKALRTGALIVEGDAVLRAPVDTGNLRASITHRVDGDEAIIGTNVEYAPYLEFGTSKQSPQPYLRPALDENKSQVRNIMGKIIGDEIRRAK